jgi:hypothetical protein
MNHWLAAQLSLLTFLTTIFCTLLQSAFCAWNFVIYLLLLLLAANTHGDHAYYMPRSKDQGSQTSLHRPSITSPPDQTTATPSQHPLRRPPWRTSSVASTTGCSACSGTPTCLPLLPQMRRPGCLMRHLILPMCPVPSTKKQSHGRR